MSKYQYNGEHYSVTIENIRFNKGEAVILSDMDEKILLNSGFGKAMLANGELTKLDEPEPKEPKKPKEPKNTKSKQAEPPTGEPPAETDVSSEPTETAGEPSDEPPSDEPAP